MRQMTTIQNIRQEPDGSNWIEVHRSQYAIFWECVETGEQATQWLPAMHELLKLVDPIATVRKVAEKYLP